MSGISIVCGLGNPGPRYRSTRHNLGFMALDLLSKRHSFSWKRAAGPAQTALWRVAGRAVTLMKPLTYMNESGIALERHSAIGKGMLLVVCDDLNLPLGKLRLRAGGGGGGHKGLESIIDRLGTKDFARLRLGIGAPSAGVDRVEFVLSDFFAEERETVDGMIEGAAEAIELAVRRGINEAAQRCNRFESH
jgi:PTH1 family peptidyl-tRNA hydrolase